MKFIECSSEIKFIKELIDFKSFEATYKKNELEKSLSLLVNEIVNKNKQNNTDPLEIAKIIKDKYYIDLVKFYSNIDTIKQKNEDKIREINSKKEHDIMTKKFEYAKEIKIKYNDIKFKSKYYWHLYAQEKTEAFLNTESFYYQCRIHSMQSLSSLISQHMASTHNYLEMSTEGQFKLIENDLLFNIIEGNIKDEFINNNTKNIVKKIKKIKNFLNHIDKCKIEDTKNNSILPENVFVNYVEKFLVTLKTLDFENLKYNENDFYYFILSQKFIVTNNINLDHDFIFDLYLQKIPSFLKNIENTYEKNINDVFLTTLFSISPKITVEKIFSIDDENYSLTKKNNFHLHMIGGGVHSYYNTLNSDFRDYLSVFYKSFSLSHKLNNF